MSNVTKLKKDPLAHEGWIRVIDKKTHALRVTGGVLVRYKCGKSMVQTFVPMTHPCAPADWIGDNKLPGEKN